MMSSRNDAAPSCEIVALDAVCEDEVTIAEMREVVQGHPELAAAFQPVRTAPPTFAQCAALREVLCAVDSLSVEQRRVLSGLLGEVGSALRIMNLYAQSDGLWEFALEPLAAAHAQLLEVWTRAQP